MPLCYVRSKIFHRAAKDISDGRNTSVANTVIVIAIINSMPILAVPGWAEREMLPKDPMVVKALSNTARGVEVIMAWLGLPIIRARARR